MTYSCHLDFDSYFKLCAHRRQAEAVRAEADAKRAEADRRAALLKSLPREPPASSIPEEAVSVALRLPGGQRQERRFRLLDSMQTLFQWAEGVGVDVQKYELSSASPPLRTFR